ncbi:protease inhibitor I42 family protein [Paracraurococcus lichenis]|uniref:Protease inhibitor I42 family protein n=1 Tax=Paracraurococcus lichenis TaxID=3064888 RepID=A0ABT9E584_9PROT|nr:protease inhibitor I42 family protein [Paracraurococcus sp. LOR1-02]MDO9711336.1 protease inhibitor I42 family protein [Paracraurococcus sp. LOR1-02]
MTSLDERANGDTVTITPGARLVLALPENPTTGYRWRLLAAGAPVLQLLDQGFTPGPPRPGAGGTHHWAWQAAQPGEAALRLDHARSWGEEPPVRQFTLTVRVGG